MSLADLIQRAPKALLHDHLDGGLRPQTVIDHAHASGYDALPSEDPADLQRWFAEAAYSGSLERYLETFRHTVGVTQTAEALRRVARECVEDLAADGVVYAEVRYAPELHLEKGLDIHEVVESVLAGIAADQATLHGLLQRIRDLGMPLVSVTCIGVDPPRP